MKKEVFTEKDYFQIQVLTITIDAFSFKMFEI